MLSELIAHHVEEEEKRVDGVFSQARKAGLDMDALGARMASEKAELTKAFKAGDLPKPETKTLGGTVLT